MRRLISCILACLFLVGCGGAKDNQKTEETTFNKNDYVVADFIKINSGEGIGDKVYIEGTVSNMDKYGVTNEGNQVFDVTNDKGEYYIACSFVDNEKFKELYVGDKSKVICYGEVMEKDPTTSIPRIKVSEIIKNNE